MMWLKVCPRCKGDVYVEKDVFDTNLKCLQCGHVLNEAEKRAVESSSPAQRAPVGPGTTPGRRAA